MEFTVQAEERRSDSERTKKRRRLRVKLPLLELPQRRRLDAVGAPGGVAHVVADRDAEPAEVGTHKVDHPPLLALDVHRCALAPIFRPPIRS